MSSLKSLIKQSLDLTPAEAALAAGSGGSIASLGGSSLSNVLQKFIHETGKAETRYHHSTPSSKQVDNRNKKFWRHYSKADHDKIHAQFDKIKQKLKLNPELASKIYEIPSRDVQSSVKMGAKDWTRILRDKSPDVIPIHVNNLYEASHELGHVRNQQDLYKYSKNPELINKYIDFTRRQAPIIGLATGVGAAAIANENIPTEAFALGALPFAPLLADEAKASYHGLRALPKGHKLRGAAGYLAGLAGYGSLAASPLVGAILKKKLQEKKSE